jgi:hypothetical protein
MGFDHDMLFMFFQHGHHYMSPLYGACFFPTNQIHHHTSSTSRKHGFATLRSPKGPPSSDASVKHPELSCEIYREFYVILMIFHNFCVEIWAEAETIQKINPDPGLWQVMSIACASCIRQI